MDGQNKSKDLPQRPS